MPTEQARNTIRVMTAVHLLDASNRQLRQVAYYYDDINLRLGLINAFCGGGQHTPPGIASSSSSIKAAGTALLPRRS
jgi:hypothetical protein